MIGIKTEREQYARWVEILDKRLKTLLPELMKNEDIDLWLTIGGDFNEEPTLDHLVPTRPLSATILAILKTASGLEFYCDGAEGRIHHGHYTGIKKGGEESFQALGRFVKEKDPKKIAVNESENFRILDSITHNFYKKLVGAIGPEYEKCIVSAEKLGMRFMETRLPEEIDDYEHVCDIARMLIEEAFTPEVVKKEKTTTADLEWWMRQKIKNAGMDYTWGPNANVQRMGNPNMMAGYDDENFVIKGGDLLHVDFGIRYMKYETDMQYLAYVLKPGETKAPSGLVRAFERCLELQDIYLECVRPGFKGNEIRRSILEKAKAKNLEAMVYSHPVGYRTHGVGPCIGRFSVKGDVLPNGELVVSENTCFAMELNVQERIPEWNNQKIFIFTEDDVVVTDEKTRVLGERQNRLILI